MIRKASKLVNEIWMKKAAADVEIPCWDRSSQGLVYKYVVGRKWTVVSKFQKSPTPECIQCKTHAGGASAPQVYISVEDWRTPEVQRSKDMRIEIRILLRQCAKEYSLGYIHAAMLTRKLIPRRRSSGLSAWNGPWSPPM